MRAGALVSETLRYTDEHSIRGISLRRTTIRREKERQEMRKEEGGTDRKLVLRNSWGATHWMREKCAHYSTRRPRLQWTPSVDGVPFLDLNIPSSGGFDYENTTVTADCLAECGWTPELRLASKKGLGEEQG